jgi:replicative DNA helicase
MEPSSLDQPLPQNLEAERTVLGAILIDSLAYAKVVGVGLRPEHFYRDAHRKVLAAIFDLTSKGVQVDIVTLKNELVRQGELERIGGAAYLSGLVDGIPDVGNVEHYAAIVKEKAILRRLIVAGQTITRDAVGTGQSAGEVLEAAEREIFAIADDQIEGGFTRIGVIADQNIEAINRLENQHGALTGISTGFEKFDEMTSGFQRGDLIIVAARPSMGKCLAADSEIVLESGEIASIGELVRRQAGRVATLEPDLRFRWVAPSAFVDDGVRPTFRVSTSLGRTIVCTASHPFLSFGGWRPLAELSVGEPIAVPRRLPVFGDGELPEERIELLAALAWENGGEPRSPVATALRRGGPDPWWNTERQLSLPAPDRSATPWSSSRQRASLGVATAPEPRSPHRPAPLVSTAAAAPLAIAPAAAADGEANGGIHPSIFRLRRSDLALFLNRLFGIGGSIDLAGKCRARVGLRCPSERMARQTVHLLLRFGIVAAFRSGGEGFRVEIAERGSLELFVREIGVFGRPAEVEALARRIASAGFRGASDRFPQEIWNEIVRAKGELGWSEVARRLGLPGARSLGVRRSAIGRGRLLRFAAALESERLRRIASADVLFDPIVSIEPVGRGQVYDLSIPDTHNFVAGDLCVHNTSLVVNIAEHMTIKENKVVGFFSLEMSKEQLGFRILSSLSKVSGKNVRGSYLGKDQRNKLTMARQRLSGARFFIDDTAAMGVMEMRAKARRLKMEAGQIDCIMVDYLQLMTEKRRFENRNLEIAAISRGLKGLAKELQCPVVALSQLSRQPERRAGDHRPQLADLRESGAIEQDADLVAFIYRDEVYNKDDESVKGVAEIIIAKQRNGPIGDFKLTFLHDITKFENLDPSAFGP